MLSGMEDNVPIVPVAVYRHLPAITSVLRQPFPQVRDPGQIAAPRAMQTLVMWPSITPKNLYTGPRLADSRHRRLDLQV